VTGPAGTGKADIAKKLEENLFAQGRLVYYLGLANSLLGVDADLNQSAQRDEYIRRLGEIAHLFTDAGTILITTISDLDDHELRIIKKLTHPGDFKVVNIGPNRLLPDSVDLQLGRDLDPGDAADEIKTLLTQQQYLIEYYL